MPLDISCCNIHSLWHDFKKSGTFQLRNRKLCNAYFSFSGAVWFRKYYRLSHGSCLCWRILIIQSISENNNIRTDWTKGVIVRRATEWTGVLHWEITLTRLGNTPWYYFPFIPTPSTISPSQHPLRFYRPHQSCSFFFFFRFLCNTFNTLQGFPVMSESIAKL